MSFSEGLQAEVCNAFTLARIVYNTPAILHMMTRLLWEDNRCKAQGSKRARLTETQASATLECRARRRRRWPQCGGPVARSAAAVSAQQRLPCRLLQPSPGSHRAKAREATVTSSSALRPPPGSGHPTR